MREKNAEGYTTVGVVSPENVRSMVSNCVTVSKLTVVRPVPGETTTGFSFAPDIEPP